MTRLANQRGVFVPSRAGQPSIDDLRADVVEWLRRLEACEAEELHGPAGKERGLLNSLVQLYNAHRGRLTREAPAPRRRLTRPIDAVEVEVILQRHDIEDSDLDDESLPGGASFPRRTMQLCVRRRQAVRSDTLTNLCAAINAVLRARGIDTTVAEADLVPVPVPLERLRQLMAGAGFRDVATFVRAVNEPIAAQLEIVRRRGAITVRGAELTADLLSGTETIALMHFQVRAITAALGTAGPALLARPGSAKPADAGRWIESHALDTLVDRIYAARQWRDGGFRIDPYSGPAENPTQPYATAQCIVGLLRAGQAARRPREVQAALKVLADTRREYRAGSRVMRGWRYFVLDGTDLDYPIADIACWVVIAEAAALRAGLWEGEHLAQATARLTDYAGDLLLQQAPSGGFVPIPQVEDRHVRTYTTTLAVWALAEALRVDPGDRRDGWVAALNGAVGWLLDHHRADVGFIPDPGVARSAFFPGLHAQGTFALNLVERLRRAGAVPDGVVAVAGSDPFESAGRLLTEWVGAARRRFEDHNVTIDRHSHFHPTRYRLENTRHLWAPWAFAALHHMAARGEAGAAAPRDQVAASFQEYWHQRGEREYGCNGTYELAEALYAFSHVRGDDEG
jgi:hypothetical protein